MDEAQISNIFDGLFRVYKMNSDEISGITVTDLIKRFILPDESKGEIKKLIRAGGLYVNNTRISDEKINLAELKPLGGRYFVLRLAKKNFYTFDIGNH